MAIISTRIDERLVHGQVANIWIPFLKVDRIVIVDDALVNNQVEKMSLKLATPEGVKLSVITVEKAIDNFQNNKYGTQKILLLGRRIAPIFELVKAGLQIDAINLGNQGKNEHREMISPSFYVSEADRKAMEELKTLGIQLYTQRVPNDSINYL